MEKRFVFLVVAVLLGTWCAAQPTTDAKRDAFNQVFFEALRQKVIDNMDEAFDLFTKARALDPGNAQVCYELGLMHFNKGNFFMAESLLETAVSLEDQNLYYLSALAEIYGKAGKYTQEEQVHYQLYALEEDESHLLRAAAAQFNNGDEKAALQTLDKIERDFGLSEAITRMRKVHYLNKGKIEKAAKEVAKLIAAYPEVIDYHRLLVQLYLANNMQKEGEKALRQLLATAPDDPRANLEMAELLRKKGFWNESFYYLERAIAAPDFAIDPKIQVLISFYKETEQDKSLLELAYRLNEATILAHPRDPKGYAMLGDFLLRDGNLAESRAAFRKAIRLPNGDKPNLWNQILLINSELNDLPAIKAEAQEAMELFPAQPLPYVLLGFAHLNDSSWEAAIAVLEAGKIYALGNTALDVQFFSFLADAYHHQGNHKQSDKYFERILEINPKNVGVLNNYAYYLSTRKEKLDKALELTKKSNDLEKENPIFLDTWAWVHFQRGEYTEALKIIQQAIALQPKSGDIWSHYGDILAKLGNRQAAITAWQQALSFDDIKKEDVLKKINTQTDVE